MSEPNSPSSLLWYHDQAGVVQGPAVVQQARHSMPRYGVGPLRHRRYSIHSALLAAKDE